MLVTFTLILVAAGALMVYSASAAPAVVGGKGNSSQFLLRYLFYGVLGLVALRLTSKMSIEAVRRATPLILGVSIFFLLAVLVPGMGVSVNGAQRWLGTGFVRFQPSEIAKFALVLYAALLIAQKPERVQSLKTLGVPLFGVFGAVSVLVMAQPDMGTDLVIVGTLLAILVAAGAQPRELGILIAGLTALALLLILVEPYRAARLTAFLHPNADPAGSGFQAMQAKIAIGSGGLFGKGPGESVQKIFYLPEAHTDMILAVIGEEFGLAGIGGLAFVYGGIAFAGLRAAKNSRDVYAKLLAIGVTSLIVVQAMLNFCAVMGIAPLTGVPLPFISYGGSSLIVSLAAMGLLMNVASGAHPARIKAVGSRGPARKPAAARSSEADRASRRAVRANRSTRSRSA